MPPKSKKNPVWYQCENCSVNVSFKELKNHSSECPSSSKSWKIPHVNSNVLYSILETARPDDLKTINDEISDGFVFISIAALQLCGFVIGEPILIQSCDLNISPMVRYIWPIQSSIPTYTSITNPS